jgi:eukaryotic-like serine/threonine-protein kinase
VKGSAIALIVGTLATALAAEPALFRGNARHDGNYDAAGVPVLHGVKWKFRAAAAIVSTPAASGGTVYFGSSDAQVYALDERSGALRWKFATHGRVSASPAVAAGRVYVGSFDGNFYALDAATGTLAWKFTTEDAQKNGPTYTRPDGTPNYRAAAGDSFYDQMVIGFDRMMSVGAVLSTPVIDGDTLFFGSWDGQLYAIS